VLNIQDVVLDTLQHMSCILIYDNECYLKPYIRRVFVRYSNMTSFMGYVNNAVIKLSIYFNSHGRIFGQIMKVITK
jgi:hypothetical protein